MKARVVKKSSDYFGMEMDVKLLNHMYVLGMLSPGSRRIKLPFDDVEFIFEHEWEKSIVKQRGILKISLPEGVSPRFYGAVCNALEQHFEKPVKNVTVLRDSSERARRNYWYKRIELVINDRYPVYITASGREYADLYNLNIEDIDSKIFEAECRNDISRLKDVIDKGMEQLKAYEKALGSMRSGDDDESMQIAAGGR